MFAWFSWLLDARLHLTLIASMVASAIGGGGPVPYPDAEWPTSRERVVVYRGAPTPELPPRAPDRDESGAVADRP